ncbi:hypothetical protein [Variovorax guangxiensis]|uniref:Membrane protein implicated in regulation of membrane protease activity n=1 Tax=Variovorax guangxiensis TaxID=1775474 RepID=A0A840G1L4_9BURK|nr:hypothetical protein [Variovorax guangxiensis]MBB4225177.1 membrane protein implicated in regulation of membrane protease activity [Variovorax guangxiensis]
MKEKIVSVGTLLCLLVLTCLLLIHALAIFPGIASIRWFFTAVSAVLGRLDAPAWVQAIGSIGAILAAAAIAGWQARSARIQQQRSRREDTAARAAALREIVRRAIIAINNADRLIQPGPISVALAIDQAELVQEAIRKIPVFEIPTPQLVFLIHRVDRDLHLLKQALLRFTGAPVTAARIDSTKARISGILTRTRAARRECVEVLTDAGNAVEI